VHNGASLGRLLRKFDISRSLIFNCIITPILIRVATGGRTIFNRMSKIGRHNIRVFEQLVISEIMIPGVEYRISDFRNFLKQQSCRLLIQKKTIIPEEKNRELNKMILKFVISVFCLYCFAPHSSSRLTGHSSRFRENVCC
jgi:hypothetical protein